MIGEFNRQSCQEDYLPDVDASFSMTDLLVTMGLTHSLKTMG